MTTELFVVELFEEYAFCGAHTIDGFPEGTRDRQMHGHVWTVGVYVSVPVGESGYAFDHARLDDVAEVVLAPVDHRAINDVPGLELGTNEVISRWLGLKFMVGLLRLDVPVRPMLKRLELGQFSSRARRLVKHSLVWEPNARDWAEARRAAGVEI